MTDHVLRTTKDIFKFLELPIQPETYKFLKEHCDPLVWKKAHVVPQVKKYFKPVADPIKKILRFPIFAVKLDHFIINSFSLFVTNVQA